MFFFLGGGEGMEPTTIVTKYIPEPVLPSFCVLVLGVFVHALTVRFLA
jgi:hypothetical protein